MGQEETTPTIDQLNAQASDLTTQIATGDTEIATVKDQISKATGDLTDFNSQLTTLEQTQVDKKAQLQAVQDEIAKLNQNSQTAASTTPPAKTDANATVNGQAAQANATPPATTDANTSTSAQATQTNVATPATTDANATTSGQAAQANATPPATTDANTTETVAATTATTVVETKTSQITSADIIELDDSNVDRVQKALNNKDLRHVLHTIKPYFPNFKTPELSSVLIEMQKGLVWHSEIVEAIENMPAQESSSNQ